MMGFEVLIGNKYRGGLGERMPDRALSAPGGFINIASRWGRMVKNWVYNFQVF